MKKTGGASSDADIITHIILRALVNIALTICITIAAIHFEQPAILWFYVIVFLNSTNYHKKIWGGQDTEC